MTNNDSSFTFEGRLITGSSKELMTGTFLHAGENLFMACAPGLAKLEVAEAMCRNAGKSRMIVNGLDEFDESAAVASEVLIVTGLPDSRFSPCAPLLDIWLNEVLRIRATRGLPTIVAAVDLAFNRNLLSERYAAVKDSKWTNVAVSYDFDRQDQSAG